MERTRETHSDLPAADRKNFVAARPRAA